MLCHLMGFLGSNQHNKDPEKVCSEFCDTVVPNYVCPYILGTISILPELGLPRAICEVGTGRSRAGQGVCVGVCSWLAISQSHSSSHDHFMEADNLTLAINNNP